MPPRPASTRGVHGPDAETERLIIAAELATFGVWDWDLLTDELYWSPAQMALLGVAPEAFVPHASTFFDRVHPDDVERVQLALRRHLEEREPYDVLMRVRHQDGHYLTQRVRGRAFRDSHGEPYRIAGIVADVTREQETQQLLEDSERRFRDMAANVPGAIFRYVLHPDGTDNITHMSQGCEELWEIPAERIQGDPTLLWHAILDEDLLATRESVMQSARTLRPWAHQWRIRTPSGRLKWVQGHGLPRKLRDGSVMWNSLLLDVTEQQETQRELYENRELLHHAQKMEALGQLTGGLAHDFNNLLAVVTAGLEYLRDEAKLAPSEREAVDESLLASQRGAELTRTLLSFARRAELAEESVSLVDTAREVGQLLRRTLPANVELELELSQEPVVVRVDRAMLENALLNLVLNARDALPEGGTAAICVSGCRGDDHPQLGFGDYARLEVRDDGSGMAEDTLARAFEPFFTTKVSGGTGLGLSMVHGFVSQSGGAITLRSEVGVGTTVVLWFPLVDASQLDPSSSIPLEANAASGRILFVEDDAAVRRSLSRVLRRHGYEVVEADSGEAALLALEQNRVDLVLSDVQMPGALQGPDLAREIRARHGLPVILLSGNPPEDRDASYLVKPIRGSELVAQIAKHLAPDARSD